VCLGPGCSQGFWHGQRISVVTHRHGNIGSGGPSAAREVAADVATVARMWVAAEYDDLRRAGPERGTRIRAVLGRHVIPWFGPQTSNVADITYFMVHEWLLALVGRRSSDTAENSRRPVVASSSEADLSLREAAVAGEVSLATARRRWRDGELVGAYRDAYGHVRVPELATAALRRSKREQPIGLS
jgi:hypothetical protein